MKLKETTFINEDTGSTSLTIPKIFNSSEKRNKFNSNESFFTRDFV